jgi:hypothetical protein
MLVAANAAVFASVTAETWGLHRQSMMMREDGHDDAL